MKLSNSLVILFRLYSLHLLCLLCLPKASNASSCSPLSCNASAPSIKFPFRINPRQPQKCGAPGFDVYCEHGGGALIELPYAGNFTVDYIYYYLQEIDLSDPNNCLVEKLISLDLTRTPFRAKTYTNFSLYNCTGNVNPDYDRIDCLSGRDYTVVSAGVDSSGPFLDGNCTLMKIVSVPGSYFVFFPLSLFTSIELTWDQPLCPSCGTTEYKPSKSANGTLALVVTLLILPFLILACCICFRYQRRNGPSANDATNSTAVSANTNTDTDAISSHNQRTATTTVGLDQVTIDSYPTVVIGGSGRLIKHDYDMCPICLSSYVPNETLKILPECLHRFHVDCIDQWLRAKATCPVCRISPLHS